MSRTPPEGVCASRSTAASTGRSVRVGSGVCADVTMNTAFTLPTSDRLQTERCSLAKIGRSLLPGRSNPARGNPHIRVSRENLTSGYHGKTSHQGITGNGAKEDQTKASVGGHIFRLYV